MFDWEAELAAQEEALDRELEAIMTEGDTPASTPASTPTAASQTEAQATAPAAPDATQPSQDELLLKLVQMMSHTSSRKVKQLDAPRVGKLDPNRGVWTGHGSQEKGEDPASGHCWREYLEDSLKASSLADHHLDACKAGLKSISTTLFCFDTEPNAGKGAQVLKQLDEYLTNHGLEGVFRIETSTGTVDMLKTPGLVNESMVTEWLYDLTQLGARSQTLRRHPVCRYDLINLDLSGHAILNSCSDDLSADLKDEIQPGSRSGPYVLYKVLEKVYKPDLAKLEELKDKLKAVKLTSFEGENVDSYKFKVVGILREMQMNFTSPDPIPNIAVLAIEGLACSTCFNFQTEVVKKMLHLNQNPSDAKKVTVAIQYLTDFGQNYRSLKQLKQYPPAQKPTVEPMKALKAEIKHLSKEMTKLSQDRSASSSKGNSNGGSNGNIKCYTCGGPHFARDCPNKDANTNSSDPSNSNSSNSNGSRGNKQRRGKGRSSKQLLSDEVNTKCNALIKDQLETMPDKSNIPADAKYTIEVDGKVVAKYCNVCGRFVKGSKQHFTSEHRKRNPNTPSPSPSPSPSTNAGGMTAAVTFGSNVRYDFDTMSPASTPALSRARAGMLAASHGEEAPSTDSEEEAPTYSFLSMLNLPSLPEGFGR